MKPTQNFLAIFSFFVFLAGGSALKAGGWTQPEGGAFTKIGVMFTQATGVYDAHGEVTRIRTLSSYTTSFYGEYGFTKRLTGIAYVPFFVRNTLNRTVGRTTGNEIEPGAANNALGDADLGIRVGLITSPFVLSVSATLGVPIGDYQDPNALLTGDGEWNQLIKLEAGFGTRQWYMTGYVGINNRTRGFSEEFRYEIEGGVKFWKERFLFSFKLSGVESLNNGNAVSNGMGLFANNVSFTAFTPELSYVHNDRWGITLGYLSAFRGVNVLAAPAYTGGVFLKIPGKNR
ncbi:MAG: hypothetical protein AAF570_11740, partial [Bacteroidota bacterium]